MESRLQTHVVIAQGIRGGTETVTETRKMCGLSSPQPGTIFIKNYSLRLIRLEIFMIRQS